MISKKRLRAPTPTLGQLLKTWREKSSLSQREAGRRLGVSASIVSYIERGRRRPSLSLLASIADLIGIEKRRAFVLVWPEAVAMINAVTPKPVNPWHRFKSRRALLLHHRVTAREIKVLKQVSQLGVVANPRYFLFVLNSIRQAMAEE
jgi:transcriptional regulator with XRE-family HTH domain